MNFTSNAIGCFNGKANFPHKKVLTATQVSRLLKDFANGSWANIQFSKTQLSKMMQLEGILADLLAVIPQAMFLTALEALKKECKKV